MPVDLIMQDATSDVMLDEAAGIRRSVLPGGARLLTQTDPSVHSASVGLWLPVGSRDERPEHAGSTHVLEHLLFKGTHRRTALDIATAFDEVGGDSNAVTAKEHTLYYGRVRSVDLPRALDVLTDMVTSSLLTEESLLTEREVILEELAAASDDPQDVGYETFLADVLGAETPLGRPVGGTAQTVNALSIQDVRDHRAEHYRTDNLVVTAVGDVDHDEVRALLLEGLARGGWDLTEGVLPSVRRRPAHPVPEETAQGRLSRVLEPRRLTRPTEQNHIYVGGPGVASASDDRHALSMLMSILGGGMSSRLFQNVREKRGLAYTVHSFSASYRDAGLFGMYAACRPSRTAVVVDLLAHELAEMGEKGVTGAEMDRARGQMAGGFALGLEDTSSRMGRLGASELIQGRYWSVEEILERIGAVTAQEVQDLAARFAQTFTARVDVGPDGT